MWLGGIRFMKQRVREHRLGTWLDSVNRDCSYGLRQLRKTPGVTFTVVVTLALGIGVNTAMFSLLNGWLLRPLPLPSPEQITVLATEQKEGSNGNFSYPDYLDFQKENESFAALFGYAFGIGGLSADGDCAYRKCYPVRLPLKSANYKKPKTEASLSQRIGM
jgi:putative ABC transport system permease protein